MAESRGLPGDSRDDAVPAWRLGGSARRRFARVRSFQAKKSIRVWPPTLAKLAASYAAGIILNHPFLDGNKRAGFMLAATFLESNGLTFNATEESVVETTLALAGGKLTEAGYAKWLAKNSFKG